MIDHIVAPRSMKNIRKVVNDIKKRCGLFECLQFPLMIFWEYILPDMFPNYRFLYVNDDELEGLEAYTDHNQKVVKIKTSVYLNALEGSFKDLFTIAHELGHLFLHDEEAIIFARSFMNVPAFRSAEWQANYFAAELLMGSHLIIDMSIEEISKECLVCKKSAEIQLKHAISERDNGRL